MTENERRLITAAEAKLKAQRLPSTQARGSVKRQVSNSLFGSTKPRLAKDFIGRTAWLADESAFLSDFYAYLRRRVPILSNGIGVWVDLSTHGARLQFEGGSERSQRLAQAAIEALDARAYEFSFCKGLGLTALMEQFYLGLYTNGRFAAELVPFADLRGVAYVALIDPFTVAFKRKGDSVVLVQRRDDDSEIELPSERVFFAAFDPDLKRPQGTSLLDAILWVVEIKEKMLEDMARASHNAGYPRLAVSVARPAQLPGETPQQFVGRANSEFDEMVDNFRDLDVDDNIFVWEGTQIEVVGKASSDFNWSINFEKVEADVSSGLRLPPWALGLNHGTTRNWVAAQHDLLMQRVGRATQHGARFMEWVMNAELAMQGIPTRARQTFEPIRDPGKLLQERARQVEFERVDKMVARGYISKDEGARFLGLRRAFAED